MGRVWRRAGWSAVHRWSSLICTLFLLVLCVTGLPLIFKEEIGDWTGTTVDPPAMPAGTGRVSLDRIVADARARQPGDAIRYVSQSDDSPAWFVSMGLTPDATAATKVFKYDARSGAMIHDVPQRRGWMYWVQALHETLLVGQAGTLFIGAMGVLFVASMVSGVVLYGPSMRKLAFGLMRRQRIARIRWLDLHNLLGIAAAGWLLLVGLTGVVNTLAQPMLLYWQRTELMAMTAPWRGEQSGSIASGSMQQAVDVARQAAPSMDVAFVGFPGSRFSTPSHYMVFMRGDTPLTSRLLKPMMIEAASGRLVSSRALPWYLTLLLVSQPLHFGDYGGLPLKLLWGLFDAVAIVVLGSGVYLWVARRMR